MLQHSHSRFNQTYHQLGCFLHPTWLLTAFYYFFFYILIFIFLRNNKTRMRIPSVGCRGTEAVWGCWGTREHLRQAVNVLFSISAGFGASSLLPSTSAYRPLVVERGLAEGNIS